MPPTPAKSPRRVLARLAVLVLSSGAAASAQSPLHTLHGAASSDGLGSSVTGAGDVDGDGRPDFVVGAGGVDTGALANTGWAGVFSGRTGAELHSWRGAQQQDGLGSTVAGAGDTNADGYDDVLVTASGAGSGGEVSLFSGRDGSLLHVWSSPGPDDRMGVSLAPAGDVDQDGHDDVLVAATLADSPLQNATGVVFLYSGRTFAPLHTWYGQDTLESFGSGVDGAGDVDHDGVLDVVVGAQGAMVAGKAAGRVYVLSGATGAVLRSWSGTYQNDHFGWSVAGGVDVDQDGTCDVVVGNPGGYDGNNIQVGETMVFSGADGSELFHWFGSVFGDDLGYRVDHAGDVDGDGWNDVLSSAVGFGPRKGLVVVYSGRTGAVLHLLPGANADDRHGDSLGAIGDADGDGHADFVTGTPNFDGPAGSFSGKAEVFAPGSPATCTLTLGSGSNAACFSCLQPPVLGGTFEVAVDASGHAGGATHTGLVVYTGASSGLFVRGGEVLVQLGSTKLASTFAPTGGGLDRFAFPVPSDPTLSGLVAYAQGFVLGGAGYALCNGIAAAVGK